MVSYYRPTEAQDAVIATAREIGGLDGVQVIWHSRPIVPNADPHRGIVNLSRLTCADGFTDEELIRLRHRSHHEFGHCKHSKGVPRSEWPMGTLHEVWNALEDRRMEHQYGADLPGIQDTFRKALELANRDIGRKAVDGEIKAPLWEALVAMSFQSEGTRPCWTLSPKAQAYYSAAYNLFVEWRRCADDRASLELAKKVRDLLSKSNEKWNEEQEKQGKPKGKKQEKKQDKKDDGEDGEGQAGRPDDFDDEDKEGKGGGGEGDDEGEEDGDGGDEGQGKGGEASDEEGDGKGDSGSGDEENEAGEPERHDGAEGDGVGGGKAGGGHRDELPEDRDEDDDGAPAASDEDIEKSLKKDMNGSNPIEESSDEACKQAMERVVQEAAESGTVPYTSMKHLDEHNVPDGDKDDFLKMRAEIGTDIFALTRTLEQALRAMAAARRMTGRRTGDLDMGRLVQVAKSLSKNVFFQIKQGTKLDTAVSLVIDESGSMWACNQIAKVVTAMGEAMSACGIPFEVVGATTKWGSGAAVLRQTQGFTRVNPICYFHYKAFGEQWAQVAHRVTDISARVHHVDGEVVEYAARRLAGRKETRKVVISMSDGDPCSGQGNDQVMGQNLVTVCERARKSGIEVYSLSIGTDSPAAYYGKKHSIVLGKAEFGQEFAKSFVKVLTEGKLKVAGV
jgi:cobalamin biosynthesis protein CobT